MLHSSLPQISSRPSPLWRLSLGLLLLCGIITWTGSAPRDVNELEVPLINDQVEQLAVAGNSENLRVRPIPRRDGAFAVGEGDGGLDGAEPALSATIFSANWRSSTSGFAPSPSVHLPVADRYTLPASRAPPKA